MTAKLPYNDIILGCRHRLMNVMAGNGNGASGSCYFSSRHAAAVYRFQNRRHWNSAIHIVVFSHDRVCAMHSTATGQTVADRSRATARHPAASQDTTW